MSRSPDQNSTLCLCMIVKDEAHVIRRALESVRPLLHHWVIVDTGSTDGTQAIIQDCLRGIPGELHQRPWVSFGHNRTEMVQLAKGRADYLLVLDADMVAVQHAPFHHLLSADFYQIRYEGDTDYCQPMLISGALDWRYMGVTHEYIHCDEATHWEFLPQLTLAHMGDGGNRADKFQRDIRLLTQGLEDEPGNVRYMFYLAQSHRDLGQWEPALHWYSLRSQQEGWEEERWYAQWQAAEMRLLLGHPWHEVRADLLAAWDARPQRMEPLHTLVRHHREQGEYLQGYMLSAAVAQGIPYPQDDLLFIDRPVYEHHLPVNFLACALACGRVSESITVANRLLAMDRLPQWAFDAALQARSLAAAQLHQLALLPQPTAPPRLVVLVPYRNPGQWLLHCVASLQQQDLEGCEIIFMDDASTDIAAHFSPPAALPARIMRNEAPQGLAANLVAVISSLRPDDVVVCLDGDDELACADALSTIREHYARHDCWVTYGSYVETNGTLGVSAPFASPLEFLSLRAHWRTSHLRTFRAGLFHRIADQDPTFSCLKDDSGDWLTYTVDAALMFPLLEMAGFHRAHFIPKVLYRYNTANALSHHNQGRAAEQRHRFDMLSWRRPFHRIHSYLPVDHPQASTLQPA